MARGFNHDFSYRDVENFIAEHLVPMGYEIIQRPGCLVDSYYCLAPDENHYNYIFRETYLNEWSSCLRLSRCAKISKALEREIEEAYIEIFGEDAI